MLIAIATILITRLYLELTGYPQIGGGNLHIAHALWGGALMMVALLVGWMSSGFGARILAVVLGGIGFGLFLDEVGKFVTKDNDYFYGPAAEIMYILVVVILVGARIIRDIRPLSANECLASATAIAAEGVARGLADHHREVGLRLVESARVDGADSAEVAHVRALLQSAGHAPDRLYRLQRLVPKLVPGFFRSPRWVPVVGWLMVIGAVVSVVFGALGIALGGYLYQRPRHHARTGRDEPGVARPAGERGADTGTRRARDDRQAPRPRRRLAVAVVAQRGADLHVPQRARRLRHRRVRRVAEHVDRPVHPRSAVLSARRPGAGRGGGRKNQWGGVTGFGGSSPARNSRMWPKPPSRHAS